MIEKTIAGTQVIERAIQIVDCFSAQQPSLSLAELVRMTGLHRATAHRILQALTVSGLLSQDPDSSRYRLGYRLIRLGELARRSNDLLQIAQPHIQELARKWGEAVVIDVPDHDLRMETIVLIPSTYRLSTSDSYDFPAWPHTTASGKVILAQQPVEVVEAYASRGLIALTPHTITDLQRLKTELAQVARQGYATNFEEQEFGLVAVGAPVMDGRGRAVAALSIGGPSTRIDGENFQAMIASVMATARQISLEMGFHHSQQVEHEKVI